MQKDRQVFQWKRTEGPEINLHIYCQLIFNKGALQFSGENTVFLTNELRQLDSHMKKNEEWLTDLSVRAEAMKVLEGKKKGV